MDENLLKLFQIKDGANLSFDDCQLINASLANIEFEDLPKIQHTNVKEYLESSLLVESVQPNLRFKLEGLLDKLR